MSSEHPVRTGTLSGFRSNGNVSTKVLGVGQACFSYSEEVKERAVQPFSCICCPEQQSCDITFISLTLLIKEMLPLYIETLVKIILFLIIISLVSSSNTNVPCLIIVKQLKYNLLVEVLTKNLNT